MIKNLFIALFSCLSLSVFATGAGLVTGTLSGNGGSGGGAGGAATNLQGGAGINVATGPTNIISVTPNVVTNTGSGYTLNGTFNGNVVTTNQVLTPYQMPGVVGYWSANQYQTYTNGQVVPNWNDLSGHNNSMSMSNIQYYSSVMNGLPALWFGNNGYASNANFFAQYPTINSNLTMVFIFKTISTATTAGNNGTLFACGDVPHPYFQMNGDTAPFMPSPGMTMFIETNRYSLGQISKEFSPDVQIWSMTYDGTNIMMWLNGRLQLNGRCLTSVGNIQNGGLGAVLDLSIGNDSGFDNQYLKGYISEVLVSSNCWSVDQVDYANSYFNQKYSRTGNNILFVGDSITVGIRTTNGCSFKDMAKNAFPSVENDVCADGGNQSWQMLTNQQIWKNEYKANAQFNILHLFDTGINEQINGMSLAQYETNVLNLCSTARSNRWKVIVGTPISFTNETLSNWRTNILSWYYLNWTNFADGLADYASIPQLGASNSCMNQTYFFNDNIHPVSAGMLLMSNTEMQAIGSVIYNINVPASIPVISAGFLSSSGLNISNNNPVIATFTGTNTGFNEIQVINNSSSGNASEGISFYGLGDNTNQGYFEVGANGINYTNFAQIGGAHDAWEINTTNNLWIGNFQPTGGSNNINMFNGGTNIALQISPTNLYTPLPIVATNLYYVQNGNLGIGTNTFTAGGIISSNTSTNCIGLYDTNKTGHICWLYASTNSGTAVLYIHGSGNSQTIDSDTVSALTGTTKITGINGLSTGATALYTVPTGRTFYLQRVIFQPTIISGVVTPPTVSVGKTASSYIDCIGATSLAGLTLTTGATQLIPIAGMSVLNGGDVLNMNISVGATATTYTFQVIVIGTLL